MKTVRFLVSLLPGVACLFLLLGIVSAITTRISGGLGIAIGVAAGTCLVLGLLLIYYNAVDWLNLRVIRRSIADDRMLADGAVVAFTGTLSTVGPPLTSPFSSRLCAAYTYVVSGSRTSSQRDGSRRFVLAQGIHMVPTVVEGPTRSLRLRALPGVEDDLRENTRGGEWGAHATKLVSQLWKQAPSAGERERQSTLLEARHEVIDEIRQDYCQGGPPASGDGLVIDEEVLPVGETVSIVGTYDAELQALTARRPRLGENVMVYRGGANEVVERVGGDLRWFAKAIGILLLAGAVLFSIAFLPKPWISKLPILGPAVSRALGDAPFVNIF